MTRTTRSRPATTTRDAIPRKKARGSAISKERDLTGTLSDLMHVPMDVFFEIMACLHPRDLLQVGRTSKYLRSIVFSKRALSIWKASLSSVLGLPLCPDDMSEPAYAALLFDRICSLCGTDRPYWQDYAIRLRLCKACHDANIKKGKEVLAEIQPPDGQVKVRLAMTPCAVGRKIESAEIQELPTHPSFHTPNCQYYAPQLRMTLTQPVRSRREGEPTEEYDNDLAANSLKRHKLATALLHWEKDIALQKKQDLDHLKARQRSIITDKLKDLGYTESDFPVSPEWTTLVEQIRDITPRTWSNLLPKLEVLLQQEKERRVREAFNNRVEQRLPLIAQYYEDFVNGLPEAQRSLMPNGYDGPRLPCLLALAERDDARGDLTLQDFLPLTAQVLQDAEAYKISARETAATMLTDSIRRIPDYEPITDRDAWLLELQSLSPEEALSRHYALFECEEAFAFGCNTGRLTFEELHAHWRTAHPQVAWGKSERPSAHVQFRARVKCGGDYDIGGKILDVAGLPRETPRTVLDELVRGGRLYCACGDPTMPPPEELNWVKLFDHLTAYTSKFRWQQIKGVKHPNPKLVLRSNHILTGPEPCAKLILEGVDTGAASARLTIDAAMRARIETRLATRPEPIAVALCRVCKATTARSQLKYGSTLRALKLPATPEGVVYHLRGWHDKEFEEKDVVWDARGLA